MNPFITELVLSQDIIDLLKEIISENSTKPFKEGITVSDVNPKATRAATYSPSLLGDDSFDFLKNAINEKVFKLIGKNLEIHSWWVMKYTGSDFTHEHKHAPQAKCVAVYYIDAPEYSGELYFPDINISIKPKTGMLVVHDANLVHGVKPNLSSEIERYNMVINYK